MAFINTREQGGGGEGKEGMHKQRVHLRYAIPVGTGKQRYAIALGAIARLNYVVCRVAVQRERDEREAKKQNKKTLYIELTEASAQPSPTPSLAGLWPAVVRLDRRI